SPRRSDVSSYGTGNAFMEYSDIVTPDSEKIRVNIGKISEELYAKSTVKQLYPLEQFENAVLALLNATSPTNALALDASNVLQLDRTILSDSTQRTLDSVQALLFKNILNNTSGTNSVSAVPHLLHTAKSEESFIQAHQPQHTRSASYSPTKVSMIAEYTRMK